MDEWIDVRMCVFAHTGLPCAIWKYCFKWPFCPPRPPPSSVSLRCRYSACALQAETFRGCLKAATQQPYAVRWLHYTRPNFLPFSIHFYIRACAILVRFYCEFVLFLCVHGCVLVCSHMPSNLASVHMHGILVLRLDKK